MNLRLNWAFCSKIALNGVLAGCLVALAACGDTGGTGVAPLPDTTTTADVGGGTDAAVTDTPGGADATVDVSVIGTDATVGPDAKDQCCADKGAQCGFVPGCPSNCGNCTSGKVCDTKQGSPTQNKCITKTVTPKLAYGAACGPNKECPSPPGGATQAQLQEHQQCLDSLCDSGNCYLGVCTKSGCTIQTDDINNGTGAKGADGIEDPDSPSDCDGATDGPAGKNFKCIEQANPAQGQSFTVCVPMGSAKACKADSDCTTGETCQFRFVYGNLQTMCGPAWKSPDGKPGAKVGELCNDDPAQGPVATCNNNFCGSTSCLAFCKTNADCGAAYECKPNIKLNNNPPFSASVCLPKKCELDKDCGSENFFCRPFWNGVANYKGEPDPVDPNKVNFPALEPGCQHKPVDSVKLGETCDQYPGSPTPGKVCQNPLACTDGSCGGLCKSDTDCAPTQKCGLSEEPVDVTDETGKGPADKTYDFTLKIPLCEYLPGAAASCMGQADCKDKAGATYCKVYTAAAELPGAPTGTVGLKLNGQCIDYEKTSKKKTGELCGPAADDTICSSGFCLGASTTQPGFCVDPCSSKADCPAEITLDGNKYKTVCRGLQLAWNSTIFDPNDDIYLPVCYPVGASNSLTDCSKDKKCPGNEMCVPFAIMANPDSAPKADWLCIAPPASATKKIGEACNPNPPQGTAAECALDCVDDVGGKGYCTGFCQTDADCGNGTVCDLNNQWVPRADKSKALIVPTCKKKVACTPCTVDTHCGPGFACTNLSETLKPNGQCAQSCASDGDCAGGGKCVDAKDMYGKTKGKVCATTCK